MLSTLRISISPDICFCAILRQLTERCCHIYHNKYTVAVLKLFFLAILSVFGEEKLYNAYNTQIENDTKEYLVNAKTDYNFNKTLRYDMLLKKILIIVRDLIPFISFANYISTLPRCISVDVNGIVSSRCRCKLTYYVRW